jgi:glycosyltransferase involved in cell wall biosynthesis
MPKQKPKIFFLLHCYHNRAGTEQHTKDLVSGLSSDFDCFVCFPEGGKVHLLTPGGKILSFPGDAALWPMTPYHQPASQRALSGILGEVKPDLVHIQHFINWPLGVLDQLTALGKPVLMSFHDYYAISPHFTLERCSDPAECLSAGYATRIFGSDISAYLLERRSFIESALKKITIRLAPSRYTAALMQSVFPGQYRVIDHGIKPFTPIPRNPDPEGVHFGFVGSLLPQKGVLPLLHAFKKLHAVKPQAKLHLFGGSAAAGQDLPGVTFHGVYNQEDLPKIYSQIDAAVIPSLFRESFSLVLSEAWLAGKPAAVSNIGALGERVQDLASGKKFEPGNVEDIIAALSWLTDNVKAHPWQIPKVRLVPEMITEYRDLYSSLLS